MPVVTGARRGRAGVLGCWACWGGCARCGGRLECRDHDLAGDHGGSRGRSRARDAVIKDQFMIMDHRAGDRSGRPRAAGEPRSRLHSSNGPPPPHRSGSPGCFSGRRRQFRGYASGRALGRPLTAPHHRSARAAARPSSPGCPPESSPSTGTATSSARIALTPDPPACEVTLIPLDARRCGKFPQALARRVSATALC
jgi:hypothetical protein